MWGVCTATNCTEASQIRVDKGADDAAGEDDKEQASFHQHFD
jgi:hypothetical protein